MRQSQRIALGLLALVVMLAWSPETQAATRYVPATYPTIQDAVDAAMAGDTIQVSPGIYPEYVEITTNRLRLIGNCSNPRLVVLDGASGGGLDGTGIEIDAEDVEVRCLTLRHYDTGIDIDGDGLYVNNVRFRNLEDYGIEGDSNGYRIINCELQGYMDSGAVDLTGDDGSITGTKIFNSGSGGFELDGNDLVFRDNVVRQTEDDYCLYVEGDGATVERFLCDGADDYGIEIDGDDNLVRYCTVQTTSDDGIYVDGDDNIIERNTVAHTDGIGITTDGDDNIVRWNDVSNSDDADCYCISGDRALVEGNKAEGCGEEGIDVDGDAFVVKDNEVAYVNYDAGYYLDCDKSVTPFDCTSATVTGNTAFSTGEDSDGFYISGENMFISRNRVDNAFEEGFCLSIDDSTFSYNKAYYTGSENEDTFYVSGDDNTIRSNTGMYNNGAACLAISGSDNLATSNVCKYNTIDGIDVARGSRNRLEYNVAQYNDGEGIENSGTDTELFRNTATNNRGDCADDGGTFTVDMFNNCADGSDFTTPQEIDD